MSSVINVRLNESMTLRFVELYRDQRLLWDKEDEAYNKRTERLRAYRWIVDQMNVDGLGVSEVASKIKNIRSTYLQELKKINDSRIRQLQMQSDDEDAAVAQQYVPKLVWFNIIDSMIGGATTKRLYSSPSPTEILSIDYAGEDINEHKYSPPSDNNDSGNASTAAAVVNKRPYSGSVSHPKKFKHNCSYEQQQSSNELFAKYIATSLEDLSPQLTIQAQKDIHEILIKYKFMNLKFDCEDQPCL